MNIIERIRALLATRRGVAVGIVAGIIVAGAVIGIILASGGGGGTFADTAGVNIRGGGGACPDSLRQWYPDEDGDGFGDLATRTLNCEGYEPEGWVDNNDDCDDTDPGLRGERRWFLDTNGDGLGDVSRWVISCTQPSGYVLRVSSNHCPGDWMVEMWYRDADGDGYGDPATWDPACVPWPERTGYVLNGNDCDDTNPNLFDSGSFQCPEEACEGSRWYYDGDGDGYGDPSIWVRDCQQRGGYVADSTDCSDTDPGVHVGQTWFLDADGDGFGDPANSIVSCEPPESYVADSTDCNDTDPAVGREPVLWYADADGDGFGDPTNSVEGCEQVAGYVADNTDCDDTDPEMRQQCICGVTLYEDADGDGFGNPANTIYDCVGREGWVDNSDDCDDTNSEVHLVTEWYPDRDGDGWGTGVFDHPAATWEIPSRFPTESCGPPQYEAPEVLGFEYVEYVEFCCDCNDWNAQVYPGAQDYHTEPFSPGPYEEDWEEWQSWDYDCDGTLTVSPVVYTSTGDYPTDRLAACPGVPVETYLPAGGGGDDDVRSFWARYCYDPPSPGWLMEPPPSGSSNPTPTGRWLSSGRCEPVQVPVYDYDDCVEYDQVCNPIGLIPIPCLPDGSGPEGCMIDFLLLFLPPEISIPMSILGSCQSVCVSWRLAGYEWVCQISEDEDGECTTVSLVFNRYDHLGGGDYSYWDEFEDRQYCTEIEEIAIPVR